MFAARRQGQGGQPQCVRQVCAIDGRGPSPPPARVVPLPAAQVDGSPTRSVLVFVAGVGPVAVLEFAQERAEVVGGAEVLVDRGEAHEGDVVEVLEPVHDELADLVGGDFLFAQAFELADDARDHALDALGLDGALAQRRVDRAGELVAIEGDLAARLLDHGRARATARARRW